MRGCLKQKEFRKQDQIGILAQNILLCGKLRLELFRESLFRTRMHGAVKCRDGNCHGEGASASAHARLVVGMVETVAVSDVVYVITFLSPLRGLSEVLICLPTACAPSTSSGQAVGCILSPLCGFPGAAKSGRVSLEVVYGIHAGLEVMREVIYTYGLP